MVENTGPSSYVPDGEEGLCHAAREIAEAYFDATEIAHFIVEAAETA